MNIVQAQRISHKSPARPIARPLNNAHAFSHLRPSTLVLLGLILVACSLVAIQRVRSQSASPDQSGAVGVLGLDSPAVQTAAAMSGASDDTTTVSPAAEDPDSPEAAGVETDGVANSSSKTTIVIETSGQTTVNGETTETEPQVIINGESVDLPKSGSFKQDIKDGDSRTKIRTKVNSDNASFNISTKNSIETGSD